MFLVSNSVMCLFLDQGFEDTENNFISPQYHPGHSPVLAHHLALETQHASLKRKKHEKGEALDGSPVLDMTPGGQVDMSPHRPLSMVVGSQLDPGMSISTSTGSLSRQVLMEKLMMKVKNKPRHEKTCFRGLRPGPKQTGLYNTEDG